MAKVIKLLLDVEIWQNITESFSKISLFDNYAYSACANYWYCDIF